MQELVLQRVIKARVLKQNGQIRKFKILAELNFDATKYFKMIDWTDAVNTEPPVIKTIIEADLWQFIAMQVTPALFFRKFYATRRLLREL